MAEIIKHLLVCIACLSCLAISNEMTYIEAKKPFKQDLKGSSFEREVHEIWGNDVNIEDYIEISLGSDSISEWKVAYISLNQQIAYVKGEPGIVHDGNYDLFDDCLSRHLEAVEKSKVNQACTKKIFLNQELRDAIVELKNGDYMDFLANQGHAVIYVKGGLLYSTGVAKTDNPNSPGFEIYNRLYDLIENNLTVTLENCHWTKLIRNVKAFFKYTDNPRWYGDIGYSCPEI